MRERLARPMFVVLGVLVLGDLLFVGLHLVHLKTSLLPSDRWSIAKDRGFAEMFQYLKFAAICLALARLFVKTRVRALLGWIALFFLLLLDDAGRIHERFGLAFAAWTQLPDVGALRARDIGELVYALFAGLLVLPAVAWSCLRDAQPARAISTDLAVLLLAFAACAVGVDFLHQLLRQILTAGSMDTLAGLIEDGGEMLVLSLTCCYVVQWVSAADAPQESEIRFRPARLLRAAPLTIRRRRRITRESFDQPAGSRSSGTQNRVGM